MQGQEEECAPLPALLSDKGLSDIPILPQGGILYKRRWLFHMSTEFVVLIGFGCTVLGALIGYLNWRRVCNNEIKLDAKDDGELRSDIGYIKRTVDEIRLDQKAQEKRINDIIERITRNEESTRQAHKRIDQIQKQ